MLILVVGFSCVSIAESDVDELEFSIRKGNAIKTLKQAAKQAGDIEILYSARVVKGQHTQPIVGLFSLPEALDLMLEGTQLEAVPVSGGEAYAIMPRAKKGGNVPERSENLIQERPTKELENQPEMNLPKENKKAIGSLLKGLLALAVASSPNLSAQDGTEEIYELSPFTVDADEDTGYAATSTLSGTRIRTNLKDLGASISVVTSELMEDLDATDAGSLLSYTANVEVGGVQGNFTGGEISRRSRISVEDARVSPQNTQRVRGLFRADLTRGLFLTDIPFDSYNTSRVTISRGPNSLLFGIGSPGGVIDNSLKEAIIGEDFGEVKIRFDNYGSLRGELDLNRNLIDGRMSLRIAALNDDTEYKQEPTWNEDRRLYADLQAVLSENRDSDFLGATLLKINGEFGTSEGSPVEVVPPTIAYTGWFEPTPSSLEQYTGQSVPSKLQSPSEGGSWVFQETYNPFVRTSEGQINTNVHPAIFQGPGVTFTDANSTIPDVGTGDGLQVNYGAIPWTSSDTLDSSGLAGTPGVIAAFGPDAPGDTSLSRFTEYHANSPFGENFAVGFTAPTLQNRDVFDYRNLIYSGGIDFIERDFSAKNIALEQTFLDNQFGIDIAYNDQHYEYLQDFLFVSGDGGSTAGPYDIYVTIAEYLSNGQPNPNFGRAYSRVRQSKVNFVESDRETFRATAFGEFDFAENDGWLKHLGKHRFTGLFSDYVLNTHGQSWWDGANAVNFDARSAGRNRRLNQSGRLVNTVVYTSDSLIGVQSADDVRLEPINIRRPQPGDTWDGIYVELLNVGKYSDENPAPRSVERGEWILERFLANETIGRSEIESKALSWQSYLLNENIVGLVGYREDDTKNFDRASESEVGFDDSDVDGRWDPDFTRLSNTPALEESADSLTWSVVARYPEKLLGELPSGMDLQAHYAESENFNPIGLRSNAFGQPIGQPTGTTKEYGITTSFADNKVSVKLNWFETSLENISVPNIFNVAGLSLNEIDLYRSAELEGKPWAENLVLVNGDPDSFPIQDYDTFYNLLENDIPSSVRSVLNPRQEDSDGDGLWDTLDWDDIPNLSSTRDLVAEGFELELVASPASGWSVMANLSRQESVNSNTAQEALAVAEEFRQNTLSSRTGELVQGQRLVADRTIGDSSASAFFQLLAAASLDGTRSLEQREWRFTGLANYEFLEGGLKGLELGGAIRWQDEAATGYVTSVDPSGGSDLPIVDPSRPHLDDGLFSGDLWASYGRKVWDERIDWKIRVNIRNAFGDDDDIPVVSNPDGQVAVVRIPNPRTITLSNSFRF